MNSQLLSNKSRTAAYEVYIYPNCSYWLVWPQLKPQPIPAATVGDDLRSWVACLRACGSLALNLARRSTGKGRRDSTANWLRLFLLPLYPQLGGFGILRVYVLLLIVEVGIIYRTETMQAKYREICTHTSCAIYHTHRQSSTLVMPATYYI